MATEPSESAVENSGPDVDEDPASDRAPSRRLSADQRREVILEAARRVFLQSGLGGARTRDIAEAAGVNEALLYRHFESKEEMFEAAVADKLEQLVGEAVARAQVGLPYDAEGLTQRMRTGAFIRELLEVMHEVAPLLGVVLFSDGDRGVEFYRERLSPAIGVLADIVERSKPTWQHRDFDAELVTTAVIGMCFGLALDRRFGDAQVDLDEDARQLTDVIFEGLLTHPSD